MVVVVVVGLVPVALPEEAPGGAEGRKLEVDAGRLAEEADLRRFVAPPPRAASECASFFCPQCLQVPKAPERSSWKSEHSAMARGRRHVDVSGRRRGGLVACGVRVWEPVGGNCVVCCPLWWWR